MFRSSYIVKPSFGFSLFVAAFMACGAGQIWAQQASNFQDSCDTIRYAEQGGQAGISANYRKRDGINRRVEVHKLGC